MQAMYKVLEQALSSLLEACAPHMPQVAQLTVAGFHTQPCAQGLLVLNLVSTYFIFLKEMMLHFFSLLQ